MHRFLSVRKNMGAAAARTASIVKIVQPHVPLIKFPIRGPAPVLKEIVNSAAASRKPVSPDDHLNAAVTTKGPSVSSKKSSATVLDSSELPQKYRRKLLSKEEMEVIEKGGPV